MYKHKPWLDVDDYMHYREPNRDRSTWTKSNEWAFGSSSFKNIEYPESVFDKDKCEVCGGKGRIWVQAAGNKNVRRGKKTNVRCPNDCEYAYDF